MLEEILGAFRAVASKMEGTDVFAQAAADVKSLEGIVAKHAEAALADARDWLAARLHPAAVPPAE